MTFSNQRRSSSVSLITGPVAAAPPLVFAGFLVRFFDALRTAFGLAVFGLAMGSPLFGQPLNYDAVTTSQDVPLWKYNRLVSEST